MRVTELYVLILCLVTNTFHIIFVDYRVWQHIAQNRDLTEGSHLGFAYDENIQNGGRSGG